MYDGRGLSLDILLKGQSGRGSGERDEEGECT